MPWCPNCKKKCREAYSVCPDCFSPLEDVPPGEHPAGAPRLLVSLGDIGEADRLEALLESADIPVARKYEGAGQYISMVGALPHLGVDLYVPESCYPTAIELIEAFSPDIPAGPQQQEMGEQRSPAGRRSKAWLLLILFTVGTALSGIALLIRFLITLVHMA